MFWDHRIQMSPFGLVWTLKIEFQPPAVGRDGTHQSPAQRSLEQFQGFRGMTQQSQAWCGRGTDALGSLPAKNTAGKQRCSGALGEKNILHSAGEGLW